MGYGVEEIGKIHFHNIGSLIVFEAKEKMLNRIESGSPWAEPMGELEEQWLIK